MSNNLSQQSGATHVPQQRSNTLKRNNGYYHDKNDPDISTTCSLQLVPSMKSDGKFWLESKVSTDD